MWLKFGHLPPGGYSWNVERFTPEVGVSAFRAYLTLEGGYLVDLQGSIRLACDFLWLSRVRRGAVYELVGEKIGDGSDGQPLIKVETATLLPPNTEIKPMAELPEYLHEDADRLVDETQKTDLIITVFQYATKIARFSKIHGPEHWLRVIKNGAQLCQETPEADPHVVFLFGVLHDTQRRNDSFDPDHGRRAADLAVNLRDGGIFEATEEQMQLLLYALAAQADGLVTNDPTIGCCWDADRLDLPRCGIEPDSEYLSTEAAKQRCAPVQ